MQEFDPITGVPITPINNAAMLAGGSKPMTAMDNPYQTGQANMNPNFIGGMANSNMPTTGMFAQEKIANLQPQIPLETSIVLNNIKSATDSGKDNVEKAIAAKGAKMPTGTVAQDRSDSTAIFMGGTAPGQFGNPGWEAAADSAKKRFPNIDANKIKGSDILEKKAPISDISEHLPIVNKRYGTEEASKKGIASIELDQSKKIPTIPAQNPGVYKSYDLSKPEPNEFDTKTSSGTRLGSGGNSEVAWRSYANDVTKPTTSGKGISGKALSSLMHLDYHGQASRMNSGPLKSPTEKINDGFRKGYDTYLEKPKVNQDKVENKMAEERRRESIINTDFGSKAEVIKGVGYTPNPNPEKNYEKGFEPFGRLSGQAKSISSRKINGNTVLGGNQPTKQSGLGAVVQFDPLSQERLTQSRRGTKCMRVKRK